LASEVTTTIWTNDRSTELKFPTGLPGSDVAFAGPVSTGWGFALTLLTSGVGSM
jgi:hypothetical protein